MTGPGRSRTASAARSAKPRRRRSGGRRKEAGLRSATTSCWRRAARRRWAVASPPPLRCPMLEGLAERFGAAQGGVFLDVGVGVAELACAFCEAVPRSRVVGLDPLPQAIELATRTVAAHGLGDRVELRHQGVEQLDDEKVFDLAWLPLPFIPLAVVVEGLARVRRALKPGGWLLLPGSTMEPGADGDIARWQVHLVWRHPARGRRTCANARRKRGSRRPSASTPRPGHRASWPSVAHSDRAPSAALSERLTPTEASERQLRLVNAVRVPWSVPAHEAGLSPQVSVFNQVVDNGRTIGVRCLQPFS